MKIYHYLSILVVGFWGLPVVPDILNIVVILQMCIRDSGGVTLSGGEPLLQPEFCQALISLCHSAGIHCAVDTAGSIPLDFCRQAVDAADLLLLDIKALDPTLCQELTGQDNQNALALLEYCEAAQTAVWIRNVLVPGLTLRREMCIRDRCVRGAMDLRAS